MQHMKKYLFEQSVMWTMALLTVPTLQAAPRATSARKPVQAAPAKQIQNARYAEFYEALKKQVKENSSDYGAAVLCVLEATDGDETAIDEWMRQAADQGNAAAQRWFVDMELAEIPNDKLLSTEVCAAYKRLGKVAEKGYVPAMLDMALCLRSGIGVPKNETAAREKLKEACLHGDKLARFQWLVDTHRLDHFNDRTKDEVDAEVKRGNHYVIYRLSSLAKANMDKAEWLRKAAEAGSPEAYFALSSLCSAKQPVESRKLLEKAVELHNADAMLVMGVGLLDDSNTNPVLRASGLTPDPKRGLNLLKTSAVLGNARACLVMGNIYYKGLPVLPQNYARAYRYFNTPRVRSLVAMSSARAYMLLRGQGVKQNTDEAIKLLSEGAKLGDSRSAIYLAYEYFSGKRIKADARQAAELLAEAAASGNPEAYVFLAYIHAKGGENLPPSADEARRFLRFASMDLGDKAQQKYDELIIKGAWEPSL